MKSEPHRDWCFVLGSAAIETILCKRLVVVHVLCALVKHLVLGFHLGDARNHLIKLTHQRAFLLLSLVLRPLSFVIFVFS